MTASRRMKPTIKSTTARVTLNTAQISRVAQLIAVLPEASPFEFIGLDYPPVGHPLALDYFFAAVVQQFGFWELKDGHYHRPFQALLDGAMRKGSDYIWRAYRRVLDRRPELLSARRQAALTTGELAEIILADDGTLPLPAPDLHLQQAQALGRDLVALDLTPQKILDAARTSATPLQSWLETVSRIGGYREDPLHKKANLLAVALSQRPERFLRPAAGEQIPPIIDYHLMRSCLRVGLVEISDPALRMALTARRELSPADEWAVRQAAYIAIQRIVEQSGKSMGAVDWFFFNARHRCPEMEEPACALCQLDAVCFHRKELFQPVLRTTFY